MFDTLTAYKDLTKANSFTPDQAEVMIDALRAIDRNMYNFDKDFWELQFKKGGFNEKQATGIAHILWKMCKVLIKEAKSGLLAA